MVNAQEYIENKYPNKKVEVIGIDNVNLEGKIDLSEYTELKKLLLIKCSLTNYDFLKTVPCKEKLTNLDVSQHTLSKEAFDRGMNYVSEFENLEYVSLWGVKANGGISRRIALLKKLHTFYIQEQSGLAMIWEYMPSADVKLYDDANQQNGFANYWRQNQNLFVKIAHNEAKLDKENEQLQKWNQNLQTQLEHTKKEKKKIEKELEKLKQKHGNCQQQIESLQKENQELQAELSAGPQQVAQIQQK